MSRVENNYDYFASNEFKDIGGLLYLLVLGGEVILVRHHPTSLLCGTSRYPCGRLYHDKALSLTLSLPASCGLSRFRNYL